MGELKPGFYKHHTKDCDIELRRTYEGSWLPTYEGSWLPENAYRLYWCNTHHQWCHEYPVKITWTFQDGTEFSKERPSF